MEDYISVSVTISRKKHFQAILSYKDNQNKLIRKSKTTGILVKPGNKRKADKKAESYRIQLERELNHLDNSDSLIKFHNYMLNWLESHKTQIKPSTYQSYYYIVFNRVVPYFKNINISLNNLKPIHIKSYYDSLSLNNTGNNTIKRHHATIRKALSSAVKMDLIPNNPADKVDLPKVHKFHGDHYTVSESMELLRKVKNTNLEIPVTLGLYLGLRRQEILGLQWSSIDFNNKTIRIESTLTKGKDKDGSIRTFLQQSTKSNSSTRTLPLEKSCEDLLQKELLKQKYKKSFFKDYYKENLVYCNNDGSPIQPDRLSRLFTKFLKDNNLRKIRLHDLRHTTATLLLNADVHMSNIQYYLGHSDYNTTSNVYAHFDKSRNLSSGKVLSNLLSAELLENK